MCFNYILTFVLSHKKLSYAIDHEPVKGALLINYMKICIHITLCYKLKSSRNTTLECRIIRNNNLLEIASDQQIEKKIVALMIALVFACAFVEVFIPPLIYNDNNEYKYSCRSY